MGGLCWGRAALPPGSTPHGDCATTVAAPACLPFYTLLCDVITRYIMVAYNVIIPNPEPLIDSYQHIFHVEIKRKLLPKCDNVQYIKLILKS